MGRLALRHGQVAILIVVILAVGVAEGEHLLPVLHVFSVSLN